MRKLALTFALASIPSLAAAQQWPGVSGQITVQTAPPPPPPPQQPVYVQQQPPQYAPPPPPPAGYAPQYPQPMQLPPPRLNYNLVYGPEPISSGARVQLVVGQSINGMGIGLALAGVADARSSSIYSGAMLLGGGVGAVASLLATRDGITMGQASAINFGTLFGGLAATFTAVGLSRTIEGRGVAGLFAGGLALGTGAGIAWASQSPLSGRVEFASSVGIWSAFVGTHLYLATRGYGTWDDATSRNEFTVLGWSSLGLTAAGLVAGVLLAPNVPVSAARMRWINLAGLGGYTVIGLSSLLLAADGSGEDALMAYSIGSIAGLGGGLVLGYFLTQNTDSYWDRMHEGVARRQGPSLTVAPGGPGGSPGLSFGGTF